METLQFSVDIYAPREKVWNALWDDKNYRNWTSVFAEGSYAETDWKEGSKALFLTPKGDGMYSTISKNTKYEEMFIKHLGVVKDGKEQPIDEETKKWSGSMEKYTLQENGNKTKVLVELDAINEFASYFKEVFPKALAKVKEISEN